MEASEKQVGLICHLLHLYYFDLELWPDKSTNIVKLHAKKAEEFVRTLDAFTASNLIDALKSYDATARKEDRASIIGQIKHLIEN